MVKLIRVLSSAAVSVVTPLYLESLGLGPLYVGAAVVLMVLGNVASNLLVARLHGQGLRLTLMAMSALTAASGVALYASREVAVIMAFLALGNISTTGTEAGPYQSVETSVIPLVSRDPQMAYTIYNFLGYAASSLGSLAVTPLRDLRAVYLGLVASGLAMLALYSRLTMPARRPGKRYFSNERSRSTAALLAAMFAADAFGGGLVSLSLLSFWFHYRYGVGLNRLGPLFSVALALTGVSILATYPLARRYGNLNIMVFSHLASNVFLVGVALSPNFTLAAATLLARQSLSQMDVPTRQAFMSEVFPREDLAPANSLTNTARLLASLPGGAIVGALVSVGAVQLPVLLAGMIKVGYDISIYAKFRGPYRALRPAGGRGPH
ncbi:MFS transporter [Acidilobus saccharovorans]|uniref:MFS transporter n=1 Tax=Acidilobus saccharovorans TaxID=242703 RepID=UPI0030845F46